MSTDFMDHRAREELVAVDSLVPWRDNPRVNDAASYEVQRAIERFGFLDPLLVRRETREVIAGHTRLKAAERLGMTEVPVIWLDIDEAQAHKLAILHNRVAERAEWDPLKLLELAEDGLDLLDAGFSEVELDELIAAAAGEVEKHGLNAGDLRAGGIAARRLTVALHLYTDEADELERLLEQAAEPGESRGTTLLRALHLAAGSPTEIDRPLDPEEE